MAFDADLAQRVREGLLAVSGALPDEKRMFGGLCFMIAGNMCSGILGDRLMARVGPQAHERLSAEPGAGEMDFTGRPINRLLKSPLRTQRGLKGAAVVFCRDGQGGSLS
ncbi:MAG: RNA methyltransferase [Alcanivorax sp.]|uniref:TfoX/Sxy family protein n=1 Tax=Alcanivorax sp. TaxID=1872427 RepID=UPI000C508ABE|nr:TfoX/Sxy family protein [Alcanivorax sp.]MBB11176.1 RNA methyltransferase [Alcanivorax sp.]MBU86421.1 RNA methyltransferase [Alcanivorax sp.]MCK5887341.1 TfoX/Sxy family protein [Alcanivorax sp.]